MATEYTVSDLGRAMKQKHPKVYDAYDDAELGRALQKKNPGAYDTFVDTPLVGPAGAMPAGAGGAMPAPVPAGQGIPKGTGPLAGGLIGGIVGGPAGAFAGGAGGALLEGAIRQPETDMLSVILDVAGAGAGQAGLEKAGQATGKVTSTALKYLLKKLTKATVRMSPRAAEAAVKSNIPMSQSGWDRLLGLGKYKNKGILWNAVSKADDAAKAAPNRFSTEQIAQDAVSDITARLRQGDVSEAEVAWVQNRAEKFVEERGKELSAEGLLRLKRSADNKVRALRRAVPGGDRPDLSAAKLWQEALGNQARSHLHATLPKVMELEEQVGSLKALRGFMKPTVGTTGSPASRSALRLLPAAVIGGSAAATSSDPKERISRGMQYALATYLLTDPRAMVAAFRMLRQPAIPAATRQIPRGLEWLYEQTGSE